MRFNRQTYLNGNMKVMIKKWRTHKRNSRSNGFEHSLGNKFYTKMEMIQ